MPTLEALGAEFTAALAAAKTTLELDGLRRTFLGKKSALNDLFASMKSVPADQKAEFARALNAFKARAEAELTKAEAAARRAETAARIEAEWSDLSLPGTVNPRGALHPLTDIERNCLSVLNMLGFGFADGPEVETAFRNFDALNVPEHHPARDAQDTFWLENNLLLRSHTSTVQIKTLQSRRDLPIRIVSPGRVYRNEAVDATHLACFHQFEGLWVDHDVTFAHLKGTLSFIVQHIFGDTWEHRFKPKFYPYTEPSIGVDIRARTPDARWITVLGAGMVHPNVFIATGHDPAKVSGFAFGLGISRMVSMAHQVENMKSLYEGDLRVHRGLARKTPVSPRTSS